MLRKQEVNKALVALSLTVAEDVGFGVFVHKAPVPTARSQRAWLKKVQGEREKCPAAVSLGFNIWTYTETYLA